MQVPLGAIVLDRRRLEVIELSVVPIAVPAEFHQAGGAPLRIGGGSGQGMADGG